MQDFRDLGIPKEAQTLLVPPHDAMDPDEGDLWVHRRDPSKRVVIEKIEKIRRVTSSYLNEDAEEQRRTLQSTGLDGQRIIEFRLWGDTLKIRLVEQTFLGRYQFLMDPSSCLYLNGSVEDGIMFPVKVRDEPDDKGKSEYSDAIFCGTALQTWLLHHVGAHDVDVNNSSTPDTDFRMQDVQYREDRALRSTNPLTNKRIAAVHVMTVSYTHLTLPTTPYV